MRYDIPGILLGVECEGCSVGWSVGVRCGVLGVECEGWV